MKWFDNIDVIDIVSAVIATPIVIAASPIIVAKVAYDTLTEDTSVPPPKKRPSWDKPTIVIGPTGAGKTTLANLLANNKIVETLPTKDKTLVSRFIMDYPGQEDCINTEWAEAIKVNKHYLYVFNLKSYDDQIMYEDHNYQKLVLWHIDLIYDWIKNKDDHYLSKFIVIGTHSDELEEDATNRILNNIKLEFKKRRKEISTRAYNLVKMDPETLINNIERG